MTGAQYIESLRKLNTRVYLFGEEVKNWVDHPMIRPSIDCVAVTYDLAHKPEYEDLMTAKSHMTGEKVNRFCHIHQSTDDLRKKVKMQRLLGQKTASCFQRCVGMDSFNAVYSTTFSPFGTSDAMDLAKMLAIREMILPLQDEQFRIWTQTRTGLLSYPTDPDEAMGHLAASVYLQMALKPDIIHVVSYSEAHHAATPADVISSCKIARRVIENAVEGAPDLTADYSVQQRKEEIIKEANVTLAAIRELAPDTLEPFTDAKILTRAVTSGILDAPQLINNPFGRGITRTGIVNGMSVSMDADQQVITEEQRIASLDWRIE